MFILCFSFHCCDAYDSGISCPLKAKLWLLRQICRNRNIFFSLGVVLQKGGGVRFWHFLLSWTTFKTATTVKSPSAPVHCSATQLQQKCETILEFWMMMTSFFVCSFNPSYRVTHMETQPVWLFPQVKPHFCNGIHFPIYLPHLSILHVKKYQIKNLIIWHKGKWHMTQPSHIMPSEREWCLVTLWAMHLIT